MRPSGTEEVNFNLCFILINLDIISHIWLMAIGMDRAALQDSTEEEANSSQARHPAGTRQPGSPGLGSGSDWLRCCCSVCSHGGAMSHGLHQLLGH